MNVEKLEFHYSKSLNGNVIIGASGGPLKVTDFFNGKIENPKIDLQNKSGLYQKFVKWNFSKDISSTSIKSDCDFFLLEQNKPCKHITLWIACDTMLQLVHVHTAWSVLPPSLRICEA